MLPASLRIPAFRRLVAASTLSVTGSLMTFMALPLVVWEETGSAATFGMVMTGGSVGMLLAMPFGGLVADRMDRRRVMLAGDVVAFTGTCCMFLLVIRELWIVLPFLALVQTLVGSLFATAGPALQRDALDDDVRAQGTAIETGAISTAHLLGPLLGAAVYGAAGFTAVIVIDLLSFAASFVLILGIRLPASVTRPARRAAEVSATARAAVRSAAADLADGFRVARRDRFVLWSLWSQLANGVSNGLMVLAVIPWLTEHLHLPAATWATIVAVMGASSLAGSLVVARIGERITPPMLMLAGLVPFVLGACLLLGTPDVVRLHAAFVLVGLTNAALQIGSSTITQRRVASSHMGRVTSFRVMCFQATQGITTALGALALSVVAPATMVQVLVATFLVNAAILAQAARVAQRDPRVASDLRARDEELVVSA